MPKVIVDDVSFHSPMQDYYHSQERLSQDQFDAIPLKANRQVDESQDTLDLSVSDITKTNDRMISIDSDDSDQESSFIGNPLRKWNSENIAEKTNLKKWETPYFPKQGDNPLKKWKETRLKQIEKSLDLIEIDDESLDDVPRPKNPSTDSIRIDASQETIHQSTEDVSKLGFIRDLFSNVKKSKIPKLVKSKSTPSALSEQILKPKEDHLIPLFEEEDPGEFDEEAKASIREFSRKYKVLSSNKVIKQIGTGGHSTVRLAERREDSFQVVAKFIHATNVWHWHDDGKNGQIPLEIWTMKNFLSLRLREVIQYYDHYKVGNRFIIIMEYLGENWTDLYDFIENNGPLKENIARRIFRTVVETVQKMHSLGYSHNDIKDENIMINSNTLEIKLIDFGSTMPLSEIPTTTFYGTQKFSCPEALGGNDYVLAEQEVWALGTLLYVMLFKMDPFANDSEILELEIEKRIQRLRSAPYGNGCPPIDISDEAADALCVMLSKEAYERPNVDELLDMPFFDIYDDE